MISLEHNERSVPIRRLCVALSMESVGARKPNRKFICTQIELKRRAKRPAATQHSLHSMRSLPFDSHFNTNVNI